MPKKTYSIVGYASGDSANTPGCNEGPRALRNRNLLSRLSTLGLHLVDLGDAENELSPEEEHKILDAASERERTIKNFPRTYIACYRLAALVRKALEANSVPLVLGGDHSLSVGSVAAVSSFCAQRGQKIGLIWVDCHGDINIPETSPSNNLFGMSVAFLTGQIPGSMAKLQSRVPAVALENLAYIGLRDLDVGEKEFIKREKVAAFTMKEVDILGMAEVARRSIEVASRNTAGYVVSFDLDVCDPALVPGTGLPIRGGLTYREAHLLLEQLSADGKMLAFEMVELNPKLDRDFATAELAVSPIESAVGKSIL